jgi:hypothetical protein
MRRQRRGCDVRSVWLLLLPGFWGIMPRVALRMMLARSLEEQGHTVRLAQHGREALDMLRAEAFDLVRCIGMGGGGK